MTRSSRYYTGIAICCSVISLSIIADDVFKRTSETRWAMPVGFAFSVISMLAIFAGRQISLLQKSQKEMSERLSAVGARTVSMTSDV